jgi:hypothetical protein
MGFGAADMPVIIFLTKIDEYDPELTTDLSTVFRSKRIFKIMQVSSTLPLEML